MGWLLCPRWFAGDPTLLANDNIFTINNGFFVLSTNIRLTKMRLDSSFDRIFVNLIFVDKTKNPPIIETVVQWLYDIHCQEKVLHHCIMWAQTWLIDNAAGPQQFYSLITVICLCNPNKQAAILHICHCLNGYSVTKSIKTMWCWN